MAEEWWKVVHDRVVRRATPSTSAKMVGMEERNAVVRGVVTKIGGVSWLKSPTLAGLDSFILIDGSSLGFGQLMVKASGSEVAAVSSGRGQTLNAQRQPLLTGQGPDMLDARCLQEVVAEQEAQAQDFANVGARLEAMETVLAQQQSQLQQLSDLSSRLGSLQALVQQHQSQLGGAGARLDCLSHGLSELSLAHEALRSEQRGLCQCGGPLPPQAQGGRRMPAKAALLRRVLGCPQLVFAVDGWIGNRGAGLAQLSSASHSLFSVRAAMRTARADALGRSPARTDDSADVLDETVWNRLRRHEPSRSLLDEWARSMTVHAVLGLAGLECTIGGMETIRFGDVYEVFNLLGLSLDHFVNKFSHMPRARSPRAAKDMADAILRTFTADTRRDEGDAIPCRDLFRLLELVGYPLRRFKSICGAALGLDSVAPLSSLRFGTYHVRRVIGRGGMNGACSYLGEDPASSDTKVAIKWPVLYNELNTCKELAGKDCLGVPKLLDSGSFEGKSYIVTELLGSPLHKLFHRLEPLAPERRWRALCVVGRLVLRRLQSLHEGGFVHCDVAPGNILLGRARGGSGSGGGTARPLQLFLIDFEQAQKCPGGRRLPIEIGSAEWSSIRAAEGGERLPEDDLEALGWVLLNGLLGPLPWFKWLTAAYRDWGSTWTKHQVVKQAQRAKVQLLRSGCRGCYGWVRPHCVPEELVRFLRLCGSSTAPGRPDYGTLAALLGGDPELSSARAERYDLSQFAEHVVPLL